ncbi:YfcC family protein [Conexibacter woesei]|uniref:YfcC family protein n=1 Tax=Conexibacter woesei TaxID=191495 RepID=UPI00042802FA|nr:YfcC family protein [Conexibacter woesei]
MSTDVHEPPVATVPPPEERKPFRFPTAFTVLAAVLLLVWVATFFVPAGAYQLDKAGGPKPGTYHRLRSCSDVEPGVQCVNTSFTFRFKQLWDAPPHGLYGVENSRGLVGADESGFLYGSAPIFLFVLAVGAFITVTMKTEAIQTGIGRLALRFRHSGSVLIAILMLVFALGGTSYGMWEESLGFFALLVPLALALGYDRMTGAAIIFLGAGTGVICSTVNPFATGVASDAAGVSLGDGIGLRIAMWIVLVACAIGYVILHARRVRREPSEDEDVAEVPRLGGRQKVVLAIFALAFIIMIYGFIPWDDLWQEGWNTDFPLPTFGNFYFPEAAALFLVMSVVVGMIAKLGEEETVNTIVAGAGDFLSAALIVVFARGITVVMKNSYMTDTILHSMEKAVSGTSSSGFAVLAFIVNLPIAFLVPSSSGHAALVMPILAPLAGFAGVPRELAVTAYQSASGLVNLVTPTSAVIMGGLTLSKVGYDKYLKFVWPYLLLVFVVVCAFLGVAAATS